MDPAGDEIRDFIARFLTAIADGDQEMAESMFEGGRVESLMLRMLIEASSAGNDIGAAANATFPNDPKLERLPMSVAARLRAKVERMRGYEPVIVGRARDGGRYASSAPLLPFYRSLELLEREGRWQVVSFDLANREASQIAEALSNNARSARDVAAKLRAGRYASIDVAIADLEDGYGRSMPPPRPVY